ncbi:MAG: ribose-5-phosphate isomerase [Candidatus Levyibacteriota bacterium]
MKVYIAADHAGLELKEKLKTYLSQKNYEVEDCGAFEYDKDDDYPDFISAAAERVAKNSGAFGVVIGKSGAGEAIVANKIKGVRAALGFSRENVLLLRTHNNANVLSLGSAFVSDEEAKKLVELFLETPFSEEERHKRRIRKIEELEQAQS